MPFRAFYMNDRGELLPDLSEDDIRAAQQSHRGLLWVDIGDTTKEDGAFLERVFGFHHLAVEDCVSPELHPPKLDNLGDYIFLVLHGTNNMSDSDGLETIELGLFIGPNFVVSNHNFPLKAISSVVARVEVDGHPMRRGSSLLAHAIMDELVDGLLPTMDSLTERVAEIEDEVVSRPTQSSLETLLTLKKSVLRLHRLMAPQRDIVNFMSRGDFRVIEESARIYYRDIYDHLVSLHEFGQSLLDQADGTLQIYLSSVANRQNEIMKVLSVFASIFLPLSLIAGIYGMNFDNMPELHWSWGYYGSLGLMVLVAGALLVWFRIRRWF